MSLPFCVAMNIFWLVKTFRIDLRSLFQRENLRLLHEGHNHFINQRVPVVVVLPCVAINVWSCLVWSSQDWQQSPTILILSLNYWFVVLWCGKVFLKLFVTLSTIKCSYKSRTCTYLHVILSFVIILFI